MEEEVDNKGETTVEVIDQGPLSIKGDFILKDLKRNNVTSLNEVRLCRCGKSICKPYCDESHKG